MSEQVLHSQLVTKVPKSTKTISDEDEKIGCFDVSELPLLHKLATERYPTAKYAHVDNLTNEGQTVFNIMLFDNDGEHVGGAELTNTKIYWDDENPVLADE